MLALLMPALTALIGKLIPDPAAAAEAQIKLATLAQNGELAELNAAVSIIVAEASGNMLQRSWRPLLMLTFAGLIVARWFGYTAPNISEAEMLELWAIVKLGLGGYVIGRSAEKIVPSIAEAMKK